jgi:hypothetical protein
VRAWLLCSTLLDLVDIHDAVITADALHAQREHARYLARRGAHCVITVKRNEPGLHAQLAALPWRDVPVAYDKRERGHGRAERRSLKVTAVAGGLAFPHAAQAIQIVRRRTAKGPGPLARPDPGAHTKSRWTRSASGPAGNPGAGGAAGGPGTAGPDGGPGWSLRPPS